MADAGALTRRGFLGKGFVFSAAALLGGTTGCGWGVASTQDPVTGGEVHILLVGDYGQEEAGFPDQLAVAKGMKAYANKWQFATDALFMLGDNFYGPLASGVNSPRWQTQFEQMYPASLFPGPAFAMPGNHDYQYAPASKFEAELAYAATGTSRWQMPAPWYTFPFPANNPLITVYVLNTNMPNEPAQPPPPNSSYYTMTDSERLAQLQWLEAELATPVNTPYRIVMGHHPLYSNGNHGNNATLIRDIDPLLRHYKVSLYLAGHDHDLQHIELPGHPTSFFLSGGGGSVLSPIRTNPAGPFAKEVYGFSHLQIRQDEMICRHLDESGNLLHKFTKTPAGVVTIVK